MLIKNTLREIKNSFSRYIAILAIVALGVGFFGGLKVTRSAMVGTVDDYIANENLFDYRIVSTLGLEESDVKSFAEVEGVSLARGSITEDILYMGTDNIDRVIRVHSITEGINELQLEAGRLPRKATECVVDSKLFGTEAIGTKIQFSDKNTKDSLDSFNYKEYTIVGIAESPYYLNFERGSTSIGNGSVAGFMYVNENAFDIDYYTEVFLTMTSKYPVYSDEYKDAAKALSDTIEDLAEERGDVRYESLVRDAQEELDDGKGEYDENYNKYLAEKADAQDELAASFQKLTDNEAELNQRAKELASQEKALLASESEIAEGLAQLAQSRSEFEQGKPYMSDAEIQATEAALLENEQKLNGSKAQVDAGLLQIAEGKKSIASGRTQIADGWDEYYEGKATADARFADAEKKLADAKDEIDDGQKEIDDIEKADVFVLNRDTNVGYACFENDSTIVDGVARVFPIFFFIVAALVCMTTMTRMVEEQRTQIGVLKALGYSNKTIIGKYLWYSGSAATIGCVAGFLIGCYVFPVVIWHAYGMMYDFSDKIAYVFDWKIALIALIVSLICSMGATWVSCYSELKIVPAELIRPKAPKDGKRILLERATFIWKKISFLYKVSLRNIFRDKKRFFMMLIGISGCTALLVTGLGIRDSIKNVVDYQYNEIQIYDCSLTFDDAQTDKEQKEFLNETRDYVDSAVFLHEGAADLITGNVTKSVNLVVTSGNELRGYIDLHTKTAPIEYPSTGEAVICKKLAESYDLKVGDEFTLQDTDMKRMTVTISDICENFVYNYVYVTPKTCQDGWGYMPEYQTAFVNIKGAVIDDGDTSGRIAEEAIKGTTYKEVDADKIYEASANLLERDEVIATSVNYDLRTRVTNMMKSLDAVILLVVLCAGALAFIVLYNLTNINITERIREIATIKVLGFFKNETNSYVFRENLILTAISAVVGLPLGKLLHHFVMTQIKVDLMYFDIRIALLSYVCAFLLTFVFAAIVSFVMYFKLDRISMSESLKTIE